MKLPEFNLFSDKSARIFLIFPSISPEFPWFSEIGRGRAVAAPPVPCSPVSYAYGPLEALSSRVFPTPTHALYCNCFSSTLMEIRYICTKVLHLFKFKILKITVYIHYLM
jgi:hypothetical protein